MLWIEKHDDFGNDHLLKKAYAKHVSEKIHELNDMDLPDYLNHKKTESGTYMKKAHDSRIQLQKESWPTEQKHSKVSGDDV